MQKYCQNGVKSRLCAIVGSQWGDEGKGKLVDILAKDYDICARFNGGSNAGHTIIVNNIKYPLHLLPCGILYEHVTNILGNGTVINIPTMFDELKQLERDNIQYKDRLILSTRAHLVTQNQIQADIQNETDPNKTFIGSTKQGIGPTYASKVNRIGLRIGDLLDWDTFIDKYNYQRRWFQQHFNVKYDYEQELKELKEYQKFLKGNNMIQDTISYMNKAISNDKRILAEGANATMLDIDFGTYPFVTSSNTNVCGVTNGLGIPPTKIQTVLGVAKAYCTRVGEGPFPTEQNNEKGEYLQKTGFEFGVTTGRVRRCGWIDIPALRYSNMLNNFNSWNITKLDVLDDLDEVQLGVEYVLDGNVIDYMPSNINEYARVKVQYETMPGWKISISNCKSFDQLPQNAKNYLKRIEELTKVPVSWVGIGPERESMLLQ